MIALVLLAGLTVALLEGPGLIRQGYWRELVVFLALTALSLALGILLALGVELPKVSSAITAVFKALLGQ
ncbi:MAG: hypothetical protein AB1331_01055 [Bacillota bacterium]